VTTLLPEVLLLRLGAVGLRDDPITLNDILCVEEPTLSCSKRAPTIQPQDVSGIAVCARNSISYLLTLKFVVDVAGVGKTDTPVAAKFDFPYRALRIKVVFGSLANRADRVPPAIGNDAD
jgi:hypothetical protein